MPMKTDSSGEMHKILRVEISFSFGLPLCMLLQRGFFDFSYTGDIIKLKFSI